MQVSLLPIVLFSAFATINSGCFAAPYTFRIIEHPYTRLQAEGINDRGQVAGWYYSDAGISGFISDGGHFTRIDYPGSSRTVVTDINNQGHVVGIFKEPEEREDRASVFVFDGLKFTTIVNSSPTGNLAALGINDNGQIVGWSYEDYGQDYCGGGCYGYIYELGKFTSTGDAMPYGNNNLAPLSVRRSAVERSFMPMEFFPNCRTGGFERCCYRHQ